VETTVVRTADGNRAIGAERRSDVTVLCFSSPVLSLEVLDELASRFEALAEKDPRSPVVLRSAHPSIFLAGAHLAEIAALDATSCKPYADRGRRAVERLENHPAPTVAAVNGSCSGGGFDFVLACDAIVASPGASFGHPGIRRGLVTGWSGSACLPFLLGSATARATLLEPRNLDAPCLSSCAAVHRIADNPLEAAIETARRLASLDPVRWQLWRALKGPGFIDRFHASVVHKLLQWRICHTPNRKEKSTIKGRTAVGNRGRERELEEP
jgi:enoyl-CoA hydratase/carnithine racemase